MGSLAVSAAAIAAILIADHRSTSPAPDVVLDEPGVYQQPGIGTNAPLMGSDLPAVDLLDLDGTRFSTSTWFGSAATPMVINVWFTTCPPCRREMPVLQQAYLDYGSNVRFVGVNVQDGASAIRSFTEELGVTYEMVRDEHGAFVVANGISAFPTTLFVDATGRVVRQVAGELTSRIVDSAVTELLAGRR